MPGMRSRCAYGTYPPNGTKSMGVLFGWVRTMRDRDGVCEFILAMHILLMNLHFNLAIAGCFQDRACAVHCTTRRPCAWRMAKFKTHTGRLCALCAVLCPRLCALCAVVVCAGTGNTCHAHNWRAYWRITRIMRGRLLVMPLMRARYAAYARSVMRQMRGVRPWNCTGQLAGF